MRQFRNVNTFIHFILNCFYFLKDDFNFIWLGALKVIPA